MAPAEDTYAIDGTILQYGNGQMYFLWSGCETFGMDPTFPQNLYIAPMSDPMTVSGPRVLIREPRSPWEMVDNAPINEGPQIIQNNGRTFVVFSASPAWSPNYCLGIFGIDELKDPLVRDNWWNDKDECIFYRNDEQGVYGTGHASFTTSPG
jgi:GH43 family beta-xylosidase